ncbi:diaminobutyrate acetyltransferase [Nitrosococcus watsonii]|uniref:L-2,4-diaminobutyric acid acetyltransferase n=1 Tax=Nitrosococcus watsoni (strain C-113) TaxID=105559 RepID=D8K6D6_NITWC|nr:diaminobutyrate acetyltransferase [Nitrosococcus watsonii]ADJ28463.1 L-2,4-diaminobutyric acid acetyltransferase [Nitrosococcus watsonii C-113]
MFRHPTIQDAPKIWQLVKDSGTLDLNSTYCYLILCKHFMDTCLVAGNNDEILAFVTGYRLPAAPHSLFIWQIAVSPQARGQGLALSMLKELLRRNADYNKITSLETTVSPSNTASRALFAALARELNTELIETPGFEEPLFPAGNHEAEPFLRLGPFEVEKLL